MKNTKNAAIYGASGAIIGYAIGHFGKQGHKFTVAAIIAIGILGAIVGNNS